MSVELWKDNRSPSLLDTISVNDEPFDLTGCTVKFRMRREGDETLVVDADASVIQTGLDPNFVDKGEVRYDWAAGDVAEAGDFLGWWHVTLPSAKTQDTPEFAVFILEHDDTIPGRDLCTIEDVLRYVPGYAENQDTLTDNTLRALITAESHEILRVTEEEFVAYGTNPQTRVFDLTDYDVRRRRIPVGAMASAPTIVSTVTQDGTAVETVDPLSVVGTPRTRAPWEPITELWFPTGALTPAQMFEGYVVSVTGDFGYPSIPPDIREACAKRVILRYLTSVSERGTVFARAAENVNIGGLFASSQEVIDGYRRPVVA